MKSTSQTWYLRGQFPTVFVFLFRLVKSHRRKERHYHVKAEKVTSVKNQQNQNQQPENSGKNAKERKVIGVWYLCDMAK